MFNPGKSNFRAAFRLSGFLALVLFWAFISGCGGYGKSSYDTGNPVTPPIDNGGNGGGGGGASLHQVNMQNTRFQPAQLSISAGDTVKWVNQDDMIHTATSGTNGVADGNWNSGNLSKGGTFTRVFNTKGTFPYYCIPHYSLGMTGSITVQ
ncbi:MAG: hypothetical protein A3F83_15735 [Candidatus Glassbacteria bacterium RIFCSPLOWO2_12_FULL_58_11]|uniref:Blue (type 1) copper domain-containing protein n=2 Tax=Candidatus Glassiibacteriota TaxID=1817805 RepID=A0A1F5YLV7_9BACT|nr:MAG: hypothetical protein A2Z86_09590 [Candidatus Glassbacteria bacterium GWA2_58_10]OGG01179.1 MAG: hypothetical protein A3F83_15735 [Candidatus Glassbacteria bacterium RIFCSPLOWO2_12_FULL_58_11]